MTDRQHHHRAPDRRGTATGGAAAPADVARAAYDAMMKGRSGVVTGFMNKVQATFSGLIPDEVLARMHRRMAEPGTG